MGLVFGESSCDILVDFCSSVTFLWNFGRVLGYGHCCAVLGGVLVHLQCMFDMCFANYGCYSQLFHQGGLLELFLTSKLKTHLVDDGDIYTGGFPTEPTTAGLGCWKLEGDLRRQENAGRCGW